MSRLLVIYTGGTIGMVQGEGGLRPSAGLVEQALQAMAPADLQIDLQLFTPLIDSSNIRPQDWNLMLDRIADFGGEAVIVVHGTDTMAFSGAALATALAGQAKRVVLCGSMQPLGQGGDAEGNLALALAAACDQARGHGVWLAFAGKLLAAAGLVKHDSHQADSFRSQPQAAFTPLRRRFDTQGRYAVISLSPGLPAAALASMLGTLDGAVLRVYGAGTMMEDPALHAALAEAIARGCRLRAVSQCEAGGLEAGAYAAGQALWDLGVVNGGVETAELALARLWLA